MSRAHGIDISYWDTSYQRAANPPRPVDFVIQRTSYGMNRDPKLDAMKPNVLAEQAKGAYHYASSGSPWKDQCDLFLSLMDGKYDFWAWDVEKYYNGQSLANDVIPSMEYLLLHAGKPGLLYCNPDTWATWLYPIQKDLVKYDLWIAYYWQNANIEGDPYYWNAGGASTMRRDWKFWQYDPNGMGGRGQQFGVGSLGLDLNVFNGTVDDLKKWLNVPAPVPQPTPANDLYRVNNPGGVNVRSGPESTAPITNTLGVGVEVHVDTVDTLRQRSHIYSPVNGWIWTGYLTPVSTPAPPPVKVCPTCGRPLP